MTDIFISFSHKDWEKAKLLADALAAEGWGVFWSVETPVGTTWREVIEENLKAAKTVVVLWSTNSVRSDWVLDEAQVARERSVLIPACIEDVELPLGFRQYQIASLTGWSGGPDDAHYLKLLAAIQDLIGPPPNQIAEAPKNEPKKQPSTRKDGNRSTLWLIPLLWFLGFNFNIVGYSLSWEPGLLYFPLAAWLGARFGATGVRLVIFGMLPAAISYKECFSAFCIGSYGWIPDYFIFILIAKIFSDKDLRYSIFSATYLSKRQILFLLIALPMLIGIPRIMGFQFSFSGYSTLFFILFLIGISLVPVERIFFLVFIACSIGNVLYLFGIDSISSDAFGIIVYKMKYFSIFVTTFLLMGLGVSARIIVGDLTSRSQPALTWLEKLMQPLCKFRCLIFVLCLGLIETLFDSKIFLSAPSISNPLIIDFFGQFSPMGLAFCLGFVHGRTGFRAAIISIAIILLLPQAVLLLEGLAASPARIWQLGPDEGVFIRATVRISMSRSLAMAGMLTGMAFVGLKVRQANINAGLKGLFSFIKSTSSSRLDRQFGLFSYRYMDLVWTISAFVLIIFMISAHVLSQNTG